MAMILKGGGGIGVSTATYFPQNSKPSPVFSVHTVHKLPAERRVICCSTLQESSTPTVSAEPKEIKAVQKEAPAKPKPPAKAPVKPLPQMMEEDVIPSLKAILEAQADVADIELSFQDDRLDGSFSKNGVPYSFWAFFPNGLTGPKGFSLSSYGNGGSSVEPFLVDEKKVTAKLLVFWIEKRLAAQGIIPNRAINSRFLVVLRLEYQSHCELSLSLSLSARKKHSTHADMDTSNPAVFCNGELLNMHSGRKIRAVVQVIQSDGGVVTGKSTDEQHLTVHGLPTVPLMNFVEVVGIAEGNKIINVEHWTDFGNTFDAQSYNQLCQLANGEFRSLFL
ncbi:Replication protein A 14 kDa subunit B, partial [Cucurbita argyrosperma subsp. sororia]